MYDEFVEDYEPTKADSYRKKVVLDGEEVITFKIHDDVFLYIGIRYKHRKAINECSLKFLIQIKLQYLIWVGN